MRFDCCLFERVCVCAPIHLCVHKCAFPLIFGRQCKSRSIRGPHRLRRQLHQTTHGTPLPPITSAMHTHNHNANCHHYNYNCAPCLRGMQSWVEVVEEGLGVLFSLCDARPGPSCACCAGDMWGSVCAQRTWRRWRSARACWLCWKP